MVRPSVSVIKRGGGAKQIHAALDKIKKAEVYVGIPSDKATRKDDEEINNAELLWIFSNGSPVHNQPERPVLQPAIAKVRKLIAVELAAASAAILQKNPDLALRHLNRAGLIATNAAKRQFDDNDWPPNAPSTIRAKGSDKPGIDTTQMRDALTWVVSAPGLSGATITETKKGWKAVAAAGNTVLELLGDLAGFE